MSVYLYSFLLVNRPRAHATAAIISTISPKVLVKSHSSSAIFSATRSHNGTFRSTATGTLIVSVLTAALYTVSTRHLTLSLSPHFLGLIYRVALRRHPHDHGVGHPCRVPHRLHGIHRVRPVRAACHLSARRTARKQVAYKPAEHAPHKHSHHLPEQFLVVFHCQCFYVSHHLRASHPRRATSPSSTFPPAYTHFFNSLQISLSEAPR